MWEPLALTARPHTPVDVLPPYFPEGTRASHLMAGKDHPHPLPWRGEADYAAPPYVA